MSNVVSKISVTLEGMMMMFVNDGASTCQVGILEHAPKHNASIEIFQVADGKRKRLKFIKGSEFERSIQLKVEKDENNIELFHGEDEIDREQDTGDQADFDWVLDFEGGEMYEDGMEVDPRGFKSVLSINDGIFSTDKRAAALWSSRKTALTTMT
jgi:hypothetical protein